MVLLYWRSACIGVVTWRLKETTTG